MTVEVHTVERRPHYVADSFVLSLFGPRGSARSRRSKCLIRKTQKFIRLLREHHGRRSAAHMKEAKRLWLHGQYPMLAR